MSEIIFLIFILVIAMVVIFVSIYGQPVPYRPPPPPRPRVRDLGDVAGIIVNSAVDELMNPSSSRRRGRGYDEYDMVEEGGFKKKLTD